VTSGVMSRRIGHVTLCSRSRIGFLIYPGLRVFSGTVRRGTVRRCDGCGAGGAPNYKSRLLGVCAY
jgi:hypothetical protein